MWWIAREESILAERGSLLSWLALVTKHCYREGHSKRSNMIYHPNSTLGPEKKYQC